MTMTDTRITTGSSADRLVTVADLQHEFDKERRLIDSRFAEAASRAEMLDYRIIGVDRKLDDFKAETLRRFELTDKRFDQSDKRFEQVDQKIDDLRSETLRRFQLVDKRFEQVDQRFDLVDQRFDQVDKRFDALDARLRSNKTLAVMSLTAAASIASVVISLLK
ncbi:MAG: hypothetical protein ACKODN_10300 [Actinomycetota bacterium]